MKGFKKVLSAFLAVVMVMTLITVTPSSTVKAATTVKPGKKLTLVVGKTAQFKKFKKGSKFKSSNKKVATVDKKGKIKAKGTGKCTITVTKGKKKQKSKITVIPANVTINSVTTSSTGPDLTVSWKAVKGATYYQLYQSTNAKTGFKIVEEEITKTSFKVRNLKDATTYYFKVKAFGKSGTTSKSFSAVKSGKTKSLGLVWSDEFNGTKLSASNWLCEVGNGIDGWGNQEKEYYTNYFDKSIPEKEKNLKVENGNLVIIPRAEVKKDGTVSYTSSRIKSEVLQEFKYGKMEIKAKATKAKGTWSAGWMLGSEGGTWPLCGEIDIFESMNGGVPQTIHCPMWNNSKENKNYNTGITQEQSSSDYHTYAVLWTDTTITFSVDGRVTGTLDSEKYRTSKYYKKVWVFNHPFFFILNCAIGGNAAGEVNLNEGWQEVENIKDGVEKTYEDYMYVDYVRVYQYK